MTIDDFEHYVHVTVADWGFIRRVETADKTARAIKLRLYITDACFVQVYTNTEKNLMSYALVLNRMRVYGRDSEGGLWHRHPPEAPEAHDHGLEGAKATELSEFLAEVQHILEELALL